MSENVIYNQGDVLVQPSVVIFGRQPYPTSSITAVRLEEKVSFFTKYPAFFGLITMFFFSVIVYLLGPKYRFILEFGLFFIVLFGFYQIFITKPVLNYTIILYFTNKSIKAYKSKNKQEVLNIIDAINQVIE